MTNSELKKKISESLNPEWFKNVELNIDFPYVNYSKRFVGISAVFEFANQQIKGWEKKDSLPKELAISLNYFKRLKEGIVEFVNTYSQIDRDRNYYWRQYVVNRSENTSEMPLLYNLTEVEYLLKIFKDYPEYFVGTFKMLINNQIPNLSDKRSFYGAILAYEFISKDFSSILQRRDSEKRSIISIRNDFEQYLIESENALNEQLLKIDNLTTEKEDEFYRWYDKVRVEDWENWYTDKLERIKNLEETYETKLKLEKPARYWEHKSTKYYNQGNSARNILILIIILSILFLSTILLSSPEWIFTNIFKGNEIKIIRWSLIFIVLISILAYTIKAISKYMFSSYHLARDAEERHTLTFFYLSLIRDTDVKDEERHMILQSLFSRTDTGLLKEDSSPTLPNSDLFNKITGK